MIIRISTVESFEKMADRDMVFATALTTRYHVILVLQAYSPFLSRRYGTPVFVEYSERYTLADVPDIQTTKEKLDALTSKIKATNVIYGSIKE